MNWFLNNLWILFPLLFLCVVSFLISALIRLKLQSKKNWKNLILQLSAIVAYILTAISAGLFHSYIHMPLSNLTEAVIFYNAYHFWRRGDRPTAVLNIGALTAILVDFGLHYLV